MVPAGGHDTDYLVVDGHGPGSCVWREADISGTDLGTVIIGLMRGEYFDPLCVVAFNTTENWSRYVTADVARESKSAAIWPMKTYRRGWKISSIAMCIRSASCL